MKRMRSDITTNMQLSTFLWKNDKELLKLLEKILQQVNSVVWWKQAQMKLVGYFLFFLPKLLEKYTLWTVLWLTFWRGSFLSYK